MPTHSRKQIVTHDADQMFDLVSDVGRYPEFLPWCAGARIRNRDAISDTQTVLVADLIISYKVFREKFTSRVTLDREQRAVDVDYIQGPFRHLRNHWRFTNLESGGSEVDFFIDFEFRSKTLQKMMQSVFDKAVERLVQAFVNEADRKYGTAQANQTGQI